MGLMVCVLWLLFGFLLCNIESLIGRMYCRWINGRDKMEDWKVFVGICVGVIMVFVGFVN